MSRSININVVNAKRKTRKKNETQEKQSKNNNRKKKLTSTLNEIANCLICKKHQSAKYIYVLYFVAKYCSQRQDGNTRKNNQKSE
jgi:hypothetical protein